MIKGDSDKKVTKTKFLHCYKKGNKNIFEWYLDHVTLKTAVRAGIVSQE